MISFEESGKSVYTYRMGETLIDAKDQIIKLVLTFNRGNKSQTARDLGVSHGTIKNWARRQRDRAICK